MKKKYSQKKSLYNYVLIVIMLLSSSIIKAQVVLETEVKISDLGLHFNGSKVTGGASNTGDNAPYDYFFGRNISAHGDAVKSYGDFVFMSWYRGGKADRHLMLSRYNKVTGVVSTIEFPHRHTGYQNRYWIGESHNTCAVGVSPKDGTVHLLYDMHAYSASKPSDGSLANDYFRYSYSIPNTATVADSEFTLDKFVKDNGVDGDYKHLRTPGSVSQSEFVALTYPSFFLNDEGDLLFFMREGGNNNGMYKFSKYDATSGTWGNFIDFNRLNAKSQSGITYNWGLYGDIKYANGKIRIGFQRRLSNNEDKYQYQNGIYYAYSDDPSGATGWKNYKGEPFDLPLWDADFIKVMEPGDYVATTQKDKVHIVGNFDWTVTGNGDVHFISRVKDNENNVTKYLHTYQPSGTGDFITSEDFSGGSALYTSGNDVYLIGLNNGRVFVDKTEGGTNNFQRVYQATSGKTFDHGVVNIKDGKVYYYLMENTSGNAMPLYLQIIDLGIVPQDPLAANNFTIQAVGETCAAKNNGKLIITGNATHDYTTTINGVDYDFTKELTIEDLTPGTYNFCIDVVGENYSHCYELTIEGGVSMTGKISVVKKSASVSVTSGTGPYKVYKNGLELFETHQTNFTIAVDHGDEIQVKSKEACQGKMTKTINLLEDIKAYPNPSGGLFEIYVPNEIETLNLEVYNIHSQIIKAKTYRTNNGKVSLDISDKPNGIYFVRINLEKPVFTKLIKK